MKRFERLSDLLEEPPDLSVVAQEFKLREEGRPNQLKRTLAGWKLPRTEKSWTNAKKAHKATINALKAREEWWSLSLGEKVRSCKERKTEGGAPVTRFAGR